MKKLDNILEERGNRYGEFKDHAELSQKLKFLIFDHHSDGIYHYNSTQREAIEMICHKLARIANGDSNYKDSWTDIAGYATLVADTLKDDNE